MSRDKFGRFKSDTDRVILNNFEHIKDEETAYWLGFLYGDGSIDKKGKLQVCLSIKDLDHLTKFSYFLCGENYVKIYKNKCVFQITDHNLAFNISKYNIIPNKTYNSKAKIPLEYYRDYIRGYFDADGWITIGKSYNKKYDRYYNKNIVGICSYNINNLLEIGKFIPIEADYNINKKKNQHLYEMRWTNKSSIENISWFLYHKTISLKRKSEKLWQLSNQQ